MARFTDERVQAIVAGRRSVGRVAFPGQTDVEVGVRLLTERDIDLARFEAQMYLERQAKKLRLDMVDLVRTDPESLDREHQRQVILAAFVDPDSPAERPRSFFDDIEQVRSLDSVLTQRLWELYVEWQDTVNPRYSLTEEEVTALLDALKDEPVAKVLLGTFERETLQSLVRFLGSQLSTALNGSASTLPG